MSDYIKKVLSYIILYYNILKSIILYEIMFCFCFWCYCRIIGSQKLCVGWSNLCVTGLLPNFSEAFCRKLSVGTSSMKTISKMIFFCVFCIVCWQTIIIIIKVQMQIGWVGRSTNMYNLRRCVFHDTRLSGCWCNVQWK